MSTSTEHEHVPHEAPPAEEETHGWETERAPGEHAHPSQSEYVKIAIVLSVLTALEVISVEIDLGPFFVPILMGLMIVKFFLVVWFFMHVKYDAKIFGRFFYAGLLVAVAVYLVMLATFQFFIA